MTHETNTPHPETPEIPPASDTSYSFLDEAIEQLDRDLGPKCIEYFERMKVDLTPETLSVLSTLLAKYSEDIPAAMRQLADDAEHLEARTPLEAEFRLFIDYLYRGIDESHQIETGGSALPDDDQKRIFQEIAAGALQSELDDDLKRLLTIYLHELSGGKLGDIGRPETQQAIQETIDKKQADKVEALDTINEAIRLFVAWVDNRKGEDKSMDAHYTNIFLDFKSNAYTSLSERSEVRTDKIAADLEAVGLSAEEYVQLVESIWNQLKDTDDPVPDHSQAPSDSRSS